MKEHTKGARPSTKNKHEKGKTQRKREKRGGEKGDDRRPYIPPRKKHVMLPPVIVGVVFNIFDKIFNE